MTPLKHFKKRSRLEEQLLVESALKAATRLIKLLRDIINKTKVENAALKKRVTELNNSLEHKNRKIKMLRRELRR